MQQTLRATTWAKVKMVAVLGAAVPLLIGAAFAATEKVEPAQNETRPEIQGDWEGAWELGGQNVMNGGPVQARIVVRLAKTNQSYAYTAVGDNLDWGRKGFRFREVVYRHPLVQMEVSDWESYQGTVNKDGTEISGKYTIAGNPPIPLTLKRTAQPASAPERLRESDYAPRPGSDLQGYWTGKLGGLPLSWKIAEETNETFRAEMDNVEQGAPHQTVAITYFPPSVRLLLTTKSGMFEGDLNKKTGELVGHWIQGPQSTPMTLRRVESGKGTPEEGSYAASGTNDLQGHWKTKVDLTLLGLRKRTAEPTLHIAKLPKGVFAASLHGLDYDAMFLPTNLPVDVPATTVEYAPPKVKIAWQHTFDYAFEGQLRDGKLSGTVRLGNLSLPLVFERMAGK
ncbi:MAG: hypothetical protein NTW03_00700 [Verrucomicrobia bacterium]|nr:hypothetical protein [Verrucomicrobiota bacterium]